MTNGKDSQPESSAPSKRSSRFIDISMIRGPGPKRRRINKPAPDPGSIYGIMRQNSGTALFVMPIAWTDMHAHLLNANWTPLPPSITPMPSPASRTQLKQPSAGAAAISRELTVLLSDEMSRPYAKIKAIKDILNTLFPDTLCRPRSAAELELRVGTRTIRKAVRLQVMWKSPDAPVSTTSFDSAATLSVDGFHSQSNRRFNTQTPPDALPEPLLGYISRKHLHTIRQHLFRIIPHPKKEVNIPVSRLQQLRSKTLVPIDLDKDAHFVAVFLAMAQRQLYGEPSSNASSQTSQSGFHSDSQSSQKSIPTFRDITVRLLTHDDETADFIVYTGVVSAGMLMKFHSPWRIRDGASPEDGIEITYARVPIWPVLGLKERLGKVLGRDIAGNIGDHDFETWGMDVNQKPNHEVLSGPYPYSQHLHSQTPPSSQSSDTTFASSPSPRGIKRPREREALAELHNQSFEEKKKHLPAAQLVTASFSQSIKSSQKKTTGQRGSMSLSLGISSTKPSIASPSKRRRISEPSRGSNNSGSGVDVTV